MLSKLKEMADKEDIEYDAEQAETSRPLFENVIKGLIGRDIYDSSTYFKVYNQHDPIFREALRLINSEEYDSILSPAVNEAVEKENTDGVVPSLFNYRRGN